MMKVIFMISVDVIEHSGAHLTSKNRNLLSCLEALYIYVVQGHRERIVAKLFLFEAHCQVSKICMVA